MITLETVYIWLLILAKGFRYVKDFQWGRTTCAVLMIGKHKVLKTVCGPLVA